MKIAILSGKGGTGKTTLSVNLSLVANQALLLDCDVEEPNAHLFLKHETSVLEEIRTEYPVVDNEKCTHCRRCAEFCRFNVFIAGKNLTIAMKELCHDCGGCAIVCPSDAIRYENRGTGTVYAAPQGTSPRLMYGKLNTGEYSGVKIIHRMRDITADEPLVIIDAPPGTSCSTVAAVEKCDFAVLVTEPTPFGVSDMKMAAEMLEEMKIPAGVVVNKDGIGNEEVYDFCVEKNLSVLGKIPFSRPIAEAYARGIPAVLVGRENRLLFHEIWQTILKEGAAARVHS